MAKLLRVKCSCGNVENVTPGVVCRKCKQPFPISEDAMIVLYRKGSPIGCAAGFGVYIDGEPYGHIGNKETIHIPLPYGTHNLHIASGMNRRCNDFQFTLTPQARIGCAKVWIKPGFWTNSFVLEAATPQEIPNF